MVELQRAGCDVCAVTKPHSKVDVFLAEHKVPRVHLPSYSPVSIRSVIFLRSLITKRNINIVHAHFHKDIWPASLTLRNDKSRGLFFSVYMGVASKDDFWHRFIFKRVDGFFTSSEAWSNQLPKVFAVSPDKVHCLPYGRTLDRYVVDTEKRSVIRSIFNVSD
jgi:hypothetical protein